MTSYLPTVFEYKVKIKVYIEFASGFVTCDVSTLPTYLC